jgi:hypothetical protein
MINGPSQEIDPPTSIHDTIVLGPGELWLWTPQGSVTPGAEKYKLYSADPKVWKVLSGMDGVRPTGLYFLNGPSGVYARDFIVDRFALTTVLSRLRSLLGDE